MEAQLNVLDSLGDRQLMKSTVHEMMIMIMMMRLNLMRNVLSKVMRARRICAMLL